MRLFRTFSEVAEIEPKDAKETLERSSPGNVGLIDVREPVEYEIGHIPGAVNIPLSTIADEAPGLDKSKPMITY